MVPAYKTHNKHLPVQITCYAASCDADAGASKTTRCIAAHACIKVAVQVVNGTNWLSQCRLSQRGEPSPTTAHARYNRRPHCGATPHQSKSILTAAPGGSTTCNKAICQCNATLGLAVNQPAKPGSSPVDQGPPLNMWTHQSGTDTGPVLQTAQQGSDSCVGWMCRRCPCSAHRLGWPHPVLGGALA